MDMKQAKGIWAKYEGDEHPHAACFDAHAFCAAIEKAAAGTSPAERMKTKKHALMRIEGVEIFASGKHNGDEYSEADLDAIVEAFNSLDYRPAVKLGHTDDPGAPAYGYIANLRRAGGKLIADFVDVSESIYDAIRDRKYERVSAEIYWNLERAGKKFVKALKAVALLGAEVPAVAGLKPLHELFANNSGEVRCYDIALRMASTPRKGADGMDEKEFKELQQRLADAEKALADEKASRASTEKQFTDMAAKLEKLSQAGDGDLTKVLNNIQAEETKTQIRDMTQRLQASERALADEKAARHAAETQITEMQSKVADLAERQRRQKIDALTGACKIPAVREFVHQFLDLATRTPATKVYALDGRTVDANAAAEAFIKFANQNALGLFKTESTATAMFEGDVSQEVANRTKTYMLEHKLPMADYSKAMAAVLDADPALKREYANPHRSAA